MATLISSIKMRVAPLSPEQRETIRDLLPIAALWFGFSLAFIILSNMFEWGGKEAYIQWLLAVLKEADRYGIANIWTSYPQYTNLLFYGIYLLTEGDGFLFWLAFKSIKLVSNFLVIAFVYLIGAEIHGRPTGRWIAFVFTLLYAPMYYGVFVNYTYDVVPMALFMLALYFLVKGKFLSFAFVAAIGGGIKLFPFIGILVLVKFLWDKRRFTDVIKTFLVCLVALSPLLILFTLNPPIFLSTYTWQMGRPPNESVYNFVFWSVNAPFTANPWFYTDHVPYPMPEEYLGPPVLARPIEPFTSSRLMTVHVSQGIAIGDSMYIDVTFKAPSDGQFRIGLRTEGLSSGDRGDAIHTPWVTMREGEEHTFSPYHNVWTEPVVDYVWLEKANAGEVDGVEVVIELGRSFDNYMNIGETPHPRISHLPVPPQFGSQWPSTVGTVALILGLVVTFYALIKMQVGDTGDILTAILFLFCAAFVLLENWSPQYVLWVLPLILLWKPKWLGDLVSIGLVLVISLEYPLSFESYQLTGAPFFVGVFWTSILVRTGMLLAICMSIWLSRRPRQAQIT